MPNKAVLVDCTTNNLVQPTALGAVTITATSGTQLCINAPNGFSDDLQTWLVDSVEFASMSATGALAVREVGITNGTLNLKISNTTTSLTATANATDRVIYLPDAAGTIQLNTSALTTLSTATAAFLTLSDDASVAAMLTTLGAKPATSGITAGIHSVHSEDFLSPGQTVVSGGVGNWKWNSATSGTLTPTYDMSILGGRGGLKLVSDAVPYKTHSILFAHGLPLSGTSAVWTMKVYLQMPTITDAILAIWICDSSSTSGDTYIGNTANGRGIYYDSAGDTGITAGKLHLARRDSSVTTASVIGDMDTSAHLLTLRSSGATTYASIDGGTEVSLATTAISEPTLLIGFRTRASEARELHIGGVQITIPRT